MAKDDVIDRYTEQARKDIAAAVPEGWYLGPATVSASYGLAYMAMHRTLIEWTAAMYRGTPTRGPGREEPAIEVAIHAYSVDDFIAAMRAAAHLAIEPAPHRLGESYDPAARVTIDMRVTDEPRIGPYLRIGSPSRS